MESRFWHRPVRSTVREALNWNPDFDDDAHEANLICQYLEMVAKDVADTCTENKNSAFHHVIRCMSKVVSNHAEEAFSPYGYIAPIYIDPDIVGQRDRNQTEADVDEAHPEFPVWRWPVIVSQPGAGGAFNGAFQPISALKLLGYSVGNQGWGQSERREFLRSFMESSLPSVIADYFDDEYGEPGSAARLRKVANVIAGNANNFLRNDPARYEVAILDWSDDLNFLKSTYYEGMGLKFEDPWPSIRLQDLP